MKRDPLAHPEELIQRVYAYAAYRIGDGPDAGTLLLPGRSSARFAIATASIRARASRFPG